MYMYARLCVCVCVCVCVYEYKFCLRHDDCVAHVCVVPTAPIACPLSTARSGCICLSMCESPWPAMSNSKLQIHE